ncbi:MAG: HAD family hydrolase [Bacteroidota bacterium]|nr:HAD family hydrolase [Bacteroidota bacterium]
MNHIPLSNIKAILLDLDDTLYAYKSCHQAAYEACMILASEKYNLFNSDFEAAWKAGRDKVHQDLHGQGASHSRLLYAQKVSEILFDKTNPQFALEIEETYWRTFLNNMKFKPEVEAFLIDAKSKGIKMCIVTDLTAQIQMRKWLKLDLGRYIDFLVSSEEAGIEKPGAYMFELAMKKLGVKAEECIMIGDSEEKDIKGAEALGIKAYLV